MIPRFAFPVALAGALLGLGGCSLSSPACNPACARGFDCDKTGTCVSRCVPSCPMGYFCDTLGVCARPDPAPEAGVPLDLSVSMLDMAPPDLSMPDLRVPPDDLALIPCSISAPVPVRIATKAPEGGLLAGDKCSVTYRDGQDLHLVDIDGKNDTIVLASVQRDLRRLISSDHQYAAVCNVDQACYFHHFHRAKDLAGSELIWAKGYSVVGGAVAIDQQVAVVAGRTGGGQEKLLWGILGPNGSHIFDDQAVKFADPPWAQASLHNTVYAILSNDPIPDGGNAQAVGDLTDWNATHIGSLVDTGVAGGAHTPALVADGMYYSAATKSDVGHLKFAPEGGNPVDLKQTVRASFGLYPSPDGKVLGFFQSSVLNPANVSFHLISRAGTAYAAAVPVPSFTPRFSSDGNRVLYADACDPTLTKCVFAVFDIKSAKSVVVGNGDPGAPFLLLGSGLYAFLGDGARLIHVDDAAVIYQGTPGVAALDSAQSGDRARIDWIERDPLSGKTVLHVFDEAAPGAMPVVDPNAAAQTRLVGESVGGLLYVQTDNGVASLHAYAYNGAAFRTVASPLADAPIEISLDKRLGLYSGPDKGLYLIDLP